MKWLQIIANKPKVSVLGLENNYSFEDGTLCRLTSLEDALGDAIHGETNDSFVFISPRDININLGHVYNHQSTLWAFGAFAETYTSQATSTGTEVQLPVN